MCLSYSLNFTTNSSYFSKIALVWFRYEPVSLNVNEVCFEEGQDIYNIHEKLKISQRRY